MKHKIKHIHFVGIGGAGMSGIAEVFLSLGYQVSGSDIADSVVTQRLANIGAHIFIGHDARFLQKADVVVISSVIKPDNPEVMAALAMHIPVVPRAMMLAELMRFKQGIAIAGTHGKTTTTSLTASIFADAKLDPTFIIGGKLLTAGANAKLGSGEFMIVEADESDASFLYLMPIISVVTNIDADHMDTYGHDFDKLKQAFVDFLNRLPFYGRAILCSDDKAVRDILPRVKKPITTYGLDDTADLSAHHIRPVGTQMHFDVVVRHPKGGQSTFPVILNMPGKHNILNALAATAIALECGVEQTAIQDGLAHFSGVGRRFQNYGDVPLPKGSLTLIDDYSHHPTEIAATISAIRHAFPTRRLLLIFQPHRYTRTRDLFEDFVQALSCVDVLVLTEVYAASELPLVASDGRSLTRAIRLASKVEPIFIEQVNDVAKSLIGIVQAGDVVVTMGAGSISALPHQIIATLTTSTQ